MEDLKEYFERLKKVNIIGLKRENKDYSFIDIYSLIAENYDFYSKLEESIRFWEQTPERNREHIKGYFNEFVAAIEQIQDFNPQQVPNPTDVWNGLKKKVEDSYNNSYNFRRDLRIYLVENEISDLQKNIGDYSKNMIDEAEKALNSIKDRNKQSDEIVKSMMEASALSGISRFAAVFEEQAALNKKSSNIWLGISAVFAIGLGGILWWIFRGLKDFISSDLSATESIQLMIAKVLLLSFASVVFYQVARNYNAHMHQYTLNKHRENCLKTFKSFVESTQDEKIRDAVLIQATKAIFESGDTGYVMAKDSPNSMFEVTKLIDKG
jgi:hypothetical protein